MNQSREPKGRPSGGQFAGVDRPDADIDLSDIPSIEQVLGTHARMLRLQSGIGDEGQGQDAYDAAAEEYAHIAGQIPPGHFDRTGPTGGRYSEVDSFRAEQMLAGHAWHDDQDHPVVLMQALQELRAYARKHGVNFDDINYAAEELTEENFGPDRASDHTLDDARDASFEYLRDHGLAVMDARVDGGDADVERLLVARDGRSGEIVLITVRETEPGRIGESITAGALNSLSSAATAWVNAHPNAVNAGDRIRIDVLRVGGTGRDRTIEHLRGIY